MSEPVAVSLDAPGLIPAGHPRSAVQAVSPGLACSHRLRRVLFPNPFPTWQSEGCAALSPPDIGRVNLPTTGPDATDHATAASQDQNCVVDDFKSPRSRFSRCEDCEPATFRFSDGRAAVPEPFVLIRPDPSWRIRRVGSTGPTRWPHIGPTVLARVQQISVRNSAPVQPRSHSLPCVHQTGSNPPPRRQLSGMAGDGRLEA
jgi:hypothetical protein